jgi:hypothetical protein
MRLDDRTARADRALFGNGRPGLISEVAANQQEMNDLKEEMQTAKERATVAEHKAPSAKERTLVNGGVLTSVIVAVWTAYTQIMGGK